MKRQRQRHTRTCSTPGFASSCISTPSGNSEMRRQYMGGSASFLDEDEEEAEGVGSGDIRASSVMASVCVCVATWLATWLLLLVALLLLEPW